MGWQSLRRKWTSGICKALPFAAAYLAADLALNPFSFSDGWTIIWPLNGLTVALLLMRPRATWVWMLLGVEVGTGLGECFAHNALGPVIGERLCSVTEVLVSAWLLPRFTTLESWLRTPRIFPRFFAALLLGPGISGLMAAMLFHYTHAQSYLQAFDDWSIADALGIAATMPLVLSLRSPQMRSLFKRPALIKTLGVLTVAFGVAVLIFSVSRYPLIFLLYPLLLLVDSLLEFSGASIVVVGVTLIALYFTTHGVGPFGNWPVDLLVPRDLALQIYFGFHLIALFPASVTFMERRRLAAELRHTNERLTILASVDGLTGIANRRSFDERYTLEWNSAMRSGSPVALAMIDLDNFKQFNDLYGHVAGDRCLRAVADVLTTQIKRPADLVARFGGEEFALLLPHTNAAGALRMAESIRAAVLDLGIEHAGNSWNRVTVSIGYSALTPALSDGESGLIKLADAALYLAKKAGRNRVETIASVEGLQDNGDWAATTARHRILRMLGRGER